MITKFYKNEKFQAVFFPVIYFLLIIAIVVTGCFIFQKKYYQPIIVDGKSMQPTLIGGQTADNGSGSTSLLRYHYGVADLNKSSVNNIRRFDVIVTYYPSSWGTPDSYKIKRVWGLPGETLSLTFENQKYTFNVSKNARPIYTISSSEIETVTKTYETGANDEISKQDFNYLVAKFTVNNKSFYINATSKKRMFTKKLEKNEYFVMGDNWNNSTDSYEKKDSTDLLTKPYIQGKVLYINAYVSLNTKNEPVKFHYFDKRFYF